MGGDGDIRPAILEAARLRRMGYSQRETARAVGVARRTVQRWEADRDTWRRALESTGDIEATSEATGDRGDIVDGPAATVQVLPAHNSTPRSNRSRHRSRLPALRTPAHGRGKLQSGNPGNRGGIAPPTEAIRARLRGSMEERIAVLEAIADNPTAKHGDRIRAIETLARYGLGPMRELSVDTVRGKLVQTIAVIRRHLPDTDAEAILREMRAIWT